jgi:hypothetical protein
VSVSPGTYIKSNVTNKSAVTYAPMCTASGTGLEETYTDSLASFSILARDRYGNLRGIGGDNWTISINKGSNYYL